MQLKFLQSKSYENVKVHPFQFIVSVRGIPVATQRCVPSVHIVQKYIVVPQVHFSGKAVDAPLWCDDWCRGRRSVRWSRIALSLSVVWCSCSLSNVSPSSP